MLYLGNSFSVNMLAGDCSVGFSRLATEQAVRHAHDNRESLKSVVGHESTALVFSRLLGVEVPTNREAVTLKPGDELLVGALGARLPEGRVLTGEELKKFPVIWWLVRVSPAEVGS